MKRHDYQREGEARERGDENDRWSGNHTSGRLDGHDVRMSIGGFFSVYGRLMNHL